MVCSPDKTALYVGVTSDLQNRIWKHKNKFYENSFTSRYNCVVLVSPLLVLRRKPCAQPTNNLLAPPATATPARYIQFSSMYLPRSDSSILENVVTTVCNGDRYQYGYNGKMKDNEWAGTGNHVDYGARGLDTRIGRWIVPDGVPKPTLSSYQYGRGNPMIFVDPDGNTEYYFNGKWVASDGVNNNMIGIVKSKGVRNSMEKGEYKFPTASNGFNNDDVFTIDANVLTAAKQVLDLALTESGKNREYRAGMNPGEGNSGYQMAEGGIEEGKPKRANEIAETEAHSASKVNIHSHPTGGELINGQPFSAGADDPSPRDMENMDTYDMSIIVGKDGMLGATASKAMDGSTSTTLNSDNRSAGINVYDKNHKRSPAAKISKEHADKILTDHAKR